MVYQTGPNLFLPKDIIASIIHAFFNGISWDFLFFGFCGDTDTDGLWHFNPPVDNKKLICWGFDYHLGGLFAIWSINYNFSSDGWLMIERSFNYPLYLYIYIYICIHIYIPKYIHILGIVIIRERGILFWTNPIVDGCRLQLQPFNMGFNHQKWGWNW